ncbi:MAG: glycosyltransferase [Ignavibacteriales bacterium]|nr:glycosyltransferase [Ignavibacteriales bacterium]
MKVLLLADSSSPHTIKWANALSESGCEIFVFSLHENTFHKIIYHKNIRLESACFSNTYRFSHSSIISKGKYLKIIFRIKKIISEFRPDIIHAHYATSYGLLGALLFFKPYIISVWGTDVLSFPQSTLLSRILFKFILSRATQISATTKYLADESTKYTSRNINVIPFGIDTNQFKFTKSTLFDEGKFMIIGAVKSFEEPYGIEYLIKAFAQVSSKFSKLNLRLLLVGQGSLEKKLKQLTQELNIEEEVIFTGFIPPQEVSRYHNSLDIAVYPSIYEGFGVAIAESMSCSKPVIASNVGGIPELIESGKNGLLVESKNVKYLSEAIEKLILNKELRIKLGEMAREKILNEYSWEKSLNLMLDLYSHAITTSNKN